MTRADELYGIIAAANAELDALRKDCNHSTYEVEWYSWRVGCMEPAKICSDCNASIGSPNQVEINTLMLGEKANRTKFLIETYGEEEGTRMDKSIPFDDCWTKET